MYMNTTPTRTWRRIMALAGCAVCLSACASMTAPPTVAVQTVCLPQKSYTPAQELAMASAVAALPADSLIVTMIADYGAMRAANRACVAQTKGPNK